VLLGGTLKPRSASENCYINIPAYEDEMHNHDSRDHIDEQSLSHRIVASSVCAFGLGGERANTRTLQEDNNTCILVNKIPLQNVSYYTFQNFTITRITENKPVQLNRFTKKTLYFRLCSVLCGCFATLPLHALIVAAGGK
jgi:hypothetical protein